MSEGLHTYLQLLIILLAFFSDFLNRYLETRKEFTTPAVHSEPRFSGELSYKDFQVAANREMRIEALRAYQLNQEEIQLVLEHEFPCSSPNEVGALTCKHNNAALLNFW